MRDDLDRIIHGVSVFCCAIGTKANISPPVTLEKDIKVVHEYFAKYNKVFGEPKIFVAVEGA